ncbi:lipopolysaccharide biosynthesis protein [Chryseobacterium indoltheticum]|uniref:lipopolysaccharide biosynthesis protein n=1 Tax=Chryseobacterium indoltheticum TaxID=254 RepID=UPI001911E4E9|nr:hypothetical protein [Chryseobacterium indoltheticum]QQQ28046.1 hypothetical protein JJL46_18545 [Chryseobacterium indoltheticum]
MRFLNIFKSNDFRTQIAKKNVVLLFVNKIIAVIISFQLIPATIGFVDSSQYGIWIAISSIVTWMVYFDFGLTHGFRNNFAKAKAKGDIDLAKGYLSTSYVVLACIFLFIMLVCLLINHYISWSVILNVDNSLNNILYKVFNLLIIFFSLQMIFNLLVTFLLANQKPAFSASIVTIGQLLSLVAIYTMSFFAKGSLVNLAYALVGIPVVSLVIISFVLFKTIFKDYAPSIKKVNFSLTKDIIGLGSKFFIIQLSMLFVFQFANFIIIRIMGAEAVTTYTIVYRYFSIIYIGMGIIFLPFWSAFTDAFTKREFSWMNETYQKLSKIWIFTIPICVVLFVFSSFVYKHWLAKNLEIDYKLSLAMGISMIILSRANLYMFCLNGIGKIYIQMLVYVIFALISAPLMFYLTIIWGYYGVILVTSLVYFCQAVVGHIQLNKILKNSDDGIWSK